MSTPAPDQLRIYHSIFFEEGWAHQKYYGWTVAEDMPGLRVLRKKRAAFVRSLLLLSRDGEASVDAAIARSIGRLGFSDVIVHDFDGIWSQPPIIDGRRFKCAGPRERLLNIATFAVDLSLDEADIFARMSSECRRKIKKAEARGVVVEALERPEAKLLQDFVEAFQSLAKERNLNPIDPDALARMYLGGDAILFVARKDGEISNYLHVYKAGRAAIFMYGVNVKKDNDGAGQYLHWHAMRVLKARGVGWYDLGGVPARDPADGIYKFKEGFGAPIVDLGTEWRHMGAALQLAQNVKAAFARR